MGSLTRHKASAEQRWPTEGVTEAPRGAPDLVLQKVCCPASNFTDYKAFRRRTWGGESILSGVETQS